MVEQEGKGPIWGSGFEGPQGAGFPEPPSQVFLSLRGPLRSLPLGSGKPGLFGAELPTWAVV